jgi:hypothetical protein
MYTDFSDVVTNVAVPATSATLTVRLIKSFEYRTERNLVLRDVDLETTTVAQLKAMALGGGTSPSLSNKIWFPCVAPLQL